MKLSVKVSRQKIKKFFEDAETSPFTFLVTITKLRKDVLGLLGEQEKELNETKALLGDRLETHDVCCAQCLMKGEYMKIKEFLE